jgi:hypothetical protein
MSSVANEGGRDVPPVPSLSPAQLEFLAENADVDVVPSSEIPRLHFISVRPLDSLRAVR